MSNGEKWAIKHELWPWQEEPSHWPYGKFDKEDYDRVILVRTPLKKMEAVLEQLKSKTSG